MEFYLTTFINLYLFCFSFVNAVINLADVSCGKQTLKQARIVGGGDAQEHEFPWLVSLTRRGMHFCGGTLIDNRNVLTAAHCLCTGSDEDMMIPATVKVIMSQHDLTKANDNAREIPVKDISIHPGYSCRKANNDIAILELKSKVQWTNSVIPACLPSVGSSRFQDSSAIIAGWGWTQEQGNKKASILQKAIVNIVDKETCQNWYKSQGKKTKLQFGQICAGYEKGGIDACWADSGGPLMVRAEGKTVVVGVISTGIGCARPYLPGLYTNVLDYVDWIKSTIS